MALLANKATKSSTLGLGGALADAEETGSRVAIAIGCLVLSEDLCNPSTTRTMVHCCFPFAFVCISADRTSQMTTMLLIQWRKQEASKNIYYLFVIFLASLCACCYHSPWRKQE